MCVSWRVYPRRRRVCTALTRLLEVECFAVCEARPPRRQSRNAHGKSDGIDAVTAARTVLGTATAELVSPRGGGLREALRILQAARRSMDTQRTRARNALTALVRTLDLGIDARSPLTAAQIATVQGWRARQGDGAAAAVIALGTELEDNQRALAEHVGLMAPGILDIHGVGPVTAAIILAAYSQHGRVRSEAAFAALAGASPIPASSGNTNRYRLNRFGDPQLNRAMDVIARTDPKPHRPRYPGLHRAAHCRRQESTGDPPVLQALHRQIALPPAPDTYGLTHHHRRVD